jgi:hypothetical protein
VRRDDGHDYDCDDDRDMVMIMSHDVHIHDSHDVHGEVSFGLIPCSLIVEE